MFWLLFFILLPIRAFAGDIDKNVLVCGKVTGSYTRSGDQLPILRAVPDINGDLYVNEVDRREAKPRSFRIKTFTYIENGIYHLGRSERSVSDAATAKDDFFSLTSIPTEGFELCVFGDIFSNKYDGAYYLTPKNFAVYSAKMDVLAPSAIPNLDTQLLNYLKNNCSREIESAELQREAHHKLSLFLKLKDSADKECPTAVSAHITQDRRASIHVDSTLRAAGKKTSKIAFNYQ